MSHANTAAWSGAGGHRMPSGCGLAPEAEGQAMRATDAQCLWPYEEMRSRGRRSSAAGSLRWLATEVPGRSCVFRWKAGAGGSAPRREADTNRLRCSGRAASRSSCSDHDLRGPSRTCRQHGVQAHDCRRRECRHQEVQGLCLRAARGRGCHHGLGDRGEEVASCRVRRLRTVSGQTGTAGPARFPFRDPGSWRSASIRWRSSSSSWILRKPGPHPAVTG